MARRDAKIHDSGDYFPVLEFDTTGGDTVMLPGDLVGSWGVVLIYRGHW